GGGGRRWGGGDGRGWGKMDPEPGSWVFAFGRPRRSGRSGRRSAVGMTLSPVGAPHAGTARKVTSVARKRISAPVILPDHPPRPEAEEVERPVQVLDQGMELGLFRAGGRRACRADDLLDVIGPCMDGRERRAETLYQAVEGIGDLPELVLTV